KVRHFHRKHLNEAKRVANWPNFKEYANKSRAEREPEKYKDYRGRTFKQITDTTMDVIKDSYDVIYPGQLLGIGILDDSGNNLAKRAGVKKDRTIEQESITLKGFVHGYLREAVQKGKPTISEIYWAAEVGDKPSIAYAAPIQSDKEGVVGLVVIW